MEKKQEVLDFICLFKSANSGVIEKIYLNGGCYRFHLILKKVYPDAVPYKLGTNKHSIEHVVTRIGDDFYDIKGIFKKETSTYRYFSKMNDFDISIAENFKY